MAAVIVLIVGSAACGSTGSPGSPATRSADSSTTTAAPSKLHTGYTAVAVAGDRAVVADGSVPTRFRTADLSSDDPTALHPIRSEQPVLARALVPVGDRVLIAGNTCDTVNSGAPVDTACSPGRAAMRLFDPTGDEWTGVSLGDDALSLANLQAVAMDDGHALVHATVRKPDSSEVEDRLFVLDPDAGTLNAKALPAGFGEGHPGGLVCLASDGVVAAMASGSGDTTPASKPSRVWHLAAPDAEWESVPLPEANESEWLTDGCVAGRPVITDNAGKRFILASDGRGWESFPGQSELFGGAQRGVPVVGVSKDRRWADGRIWRFDPTAMTYVDTGVPSDRLDGSVRASAAWGSDHVVALVDPSGALVDDNAPANVSLRVIPTSQANQ